MYTPIIRLGVIALSAVVLSSCSWFSGNMSADITRDPYVEAALNSREGQLAQLLVASGNRFVDCIDEYNALLAEEGNPIPSAVVEDTKRCTLSLEYYIAEDGAQRKTVVLQRVYHPSCGYIPSKEDMVRVEVEGTDFTTLARWVTPSLVPSTGEEATLEAAVPSPTCQGFLQVLFPTSYPEEE